MAAVNLTHSQSNKVLRDYMDELGDEAYVQLLMKVVRECNRRKIDKDELIVKIKRAWHEPKEGRKLGHSSGIDDSI